MDFNAVEPSIGRDARLFLLDLVRKTIHTRFDGDPLPSPEPAATVLHEPRGAFVTLKIDGRLRGCIGHVVGVVPLWQAVRDNAIAAAFDDPRFDPSADRRTGYHTHNLLCMPLIDDGGRVFGVAQLLNKAKGERPFDAVDERRFRDFAGKMGVILESWGHMARPDRQRSSTGAPPAGGRPYLE